MLAYRYVLHMSINIFFTTGFVVRGDDKQPEQECGQGHVLEY